MAISPSHHPRMLTKCSRPSRGRTPQLRCLQPQLRPRNEPQFSATLPAQGFKYLTAVGASLVLNQRLMAMRALLSASWTSILRSRCTAVGVQVSLGFCVVLPLPPTFPSRLCSPTGEQEPMTPFSGRSRPGPAARRYQSLGNRHPCDLRSNEREATFIT
ncbi:hypothetical protein B0H12DRAFT_274652 [Mycena haematopus]|nr:hypothetical protein B0H12DRAFT_274652 [Mycena haematopus]